MLTHVRVMHPVIDFARQYSALPAGHEVVEDDAGSLQVTAHRQASAAAAEQQRGGPHVLLQELLSVQVAGACSVTHVTKTQSHAVQASQDGDLTRAISVASHQRPCDFMYNASPRIDAAIHMNYLTFINHAVHSQAIQSNCVKYKQIKKMRVKLNICTSMC